MFSIRYAGLTITLLLVTMEGVQPALAQRERERKVLTNEDVARPAPSPPAAATPAETAEAPATKPPSSESAPGAPAAAVQPTGPPELNLAQQLQGTLRDNLAAYSEKLQAETAPDRQERWRNMIDTAMSLMQQNQLYIRELESEIPRASPPPAAP